MADELYTITTPINNNANIRIVKNKSGACCDLFFDLNKKTPHFPKNIGTWGYVNKPPILMYAQLPQTCLLYLQKFCTGPSLHMLVKEG